MADIAEGTYGCVVIDASYGGNDKNLPVARINIEITDGPHKGQRMTYEEAPDAKQAKYIARTAKAIGWRGPSLNSLKAEVAEWIAKTGGATTVEVKHVEIKRGNRFNKWTEGGCQGPPPVWVKVGSLGRGAQPLKPVSGEAAEDADYAMRKALEEDGYQTEAAPSASTSGGNGDFGGYGGGGSLSPPGDDDIPFISSSWTSDRAPMTRARW